MKLFYFLLLFCNLLPIAAQSIRDTTQLNEVVIVENRFQTAQKKSAQNVTSLNAKDLEFLPVRSLAEALAFVPGVDIRQRGVFGAQADIGLRGGSFEQTLILVNGMKLTDPQTGHHSMNLPLPFFSLHQIDVLKGPAARVYGQNAFAGAINITTYLPDQRCIKAQVFTGDFSLYGANILLALPHKRIKQAVSASASQNGSYNYNTDAKQGSLLYEAQVAIAKYHNVRALIAASTRSMGANGFYSDKYPDQWEATNTLMVGLTYDYCGRQSKFQLKNYVRMNEDEFRLKRTVPSFYTNNHRSEIYAVEGNGSVKSKYGETGYGVDLRREQLISSNLGAHRRNSIGAYIEHKFQMAKLSVRAGAYGNYYDSYGLHYFPGAELGYQLKKKHFIYGNWGYSFRIPTYTELYYKDPVTGSNPNLMPEKAQSAELGYRCSVGAVFIEANVFRRTTLNMIDYTNQSSQSAGSSNLWMPTNYTHTNFNGAELTLNYKLKVKDSLFAISAVRGSYNYILAAIQQNETVKSRYSLNQLKQQAIVCLEFLLLNKTNISLNVRYLQKQDLNQYILADAKATYQLTGYLSIFAECSNLTNQNYIETGFVQMPSRWFRAGITVKL